MNLLHLIGIVAYILIVLTGCQTVNYKNCDNFYIEQELKKSGDGSSK
jgi:hypothetical protein